MVLAGQSEVNQALAHNVALRSGKSWDRVRRKTQRGPGPACSVLRSAAYWHTRGC